MGNETSIAEKDILSRDSTQLSSKEDLGGVLFDKVNAIIKENPDKITGMLLEMPERDLEVALCDETFLKTRIDQAVKSLHLQTVKGEISERMAALGDVIYSYVQTVYTEEDMASKITGMLLEMEEVVVEDLIRNKQDLLVKVHEAANVLRMKKDARARASESQISKLLAPTQEEMGEKIFEKLMTWYPEEQAAKLTGMILEMDKDDMMKVAQDENLLKYKVGEAEHVLKMHKV